MAIADIAIQIITKGANLAKQQLDGLSGSTGKASGKFSQLAKAGAVVGFKKNRDYKVEIDGKDYYRIAISQLLYEIQDS